MADKIKIKPSKVGSLHKALGIPEGSMIPESTIRSKLAGSPSEGMRKKLQFAENAKKWGKT